MLDLRDLLAGQRIHGPLAVREKQGLGRYQGGFCYTLVVGNRTGHVTAKAWLGADEAQVRAGYEAFGVGDIVHVEARVTRYRGELELSLETPPAPVDPEEVDPQAFLPQGTADPERLHRRLVGRARSIGHDQLRDLVLLLWDEQAEALGLPQAPAATRGHGAWLGGLVEATHTRVEMAEVLCRAYPALDRDLLLTGALLADVGTSQGLQWTGAIAPTEPGVLLGHRRLTDAVLQKATERIEAMPEALVDRVRHLVLADERAPVGTAPRPALPEAHALDQIRALTANVGRFLEACRALEESGEQAGWSRQLSRHLLLEPVGQEGTTTNTTGTTT